MGKWKSKLYVRVQTKTGSPIAVNQILTPIQDINPVINTPNTPEHSLEASNVNVVGGDDTFTFTMTVKATLDPVTNTCPADILTALQLNHLPFDIVMAERQLSGSGGQNWGFKGIMLEDCYVNSGTPSRNALGGSPTAIFNCMCLGVNIDSQTFGSQSFNGNPEA